MLSGRIFVAFVSKTLTMVIKSVT